MENTINGDDVQNFVNGQGTVQVNQALAQGNVPQGNVGGGKIADICGDFGRSGITLVRSCSNILRGLGDREAQIEVQIANNGIDQRAAAALRKSQSTIWEFIHIVLKIILSIYEAFLATARNVFARA